MKVPTLAATSPACRNCHFYLAHDAEAGFCRRFPPVAQLVETDEGDWTPMQAWAVVSVGEWCGEWKAAQ